MWLSAAGQPRRHNDDELHEFVKRTFFKGMQVMVHVIGDHLTS
jgi:predicted amidohydrolase YtcJ